MLVGDRAWLSACTDSPRASASGLFTGQADNHALSHCSMIPSLDLECYGISGKCVTIHNDFIHYYDSFRKKIV